MTDSYNDDPFANAEKRPAISFKDAPVGTVQTIDISEPARNVQQRDFDTDEPAFWPAKPGQEANPKMAAVYNGTNSDGEPVSLWAPNPGSLFSELGKAEIESRKGGHRLGDGPNVQRIYVKFVSTEPAKNPKHSPRKLYAVKVENLGQKQTAPATGDPFANSADDNWAGSSASFDEAPPF